MLRSLLAAFLHLRKRNFIFNSKSRGFFAFECFITIGVVFKLTVVPVALVFEEARFAGYGALNAFVDVMLLLDILVRFRTSFEERGFEVTAWRRIASRYSKSWLIVDIVASLPFFLGESFDAPDALPGRPGIVPPLQWGLAMARIASVRRLVALMAQLCSSRSVTKHAYLAAFLPAACLVFNFVLSAHWLGLIWYIIAIRPLESDPSFDTLKDWHWLNTSTSSFDDDGAPFNTGYSVGTRYICSLYWALAVLTNLKGLPAHESRQCLWRDELVTNPLVERTYTIGVFIFGAVFYSCIYGNIAQYIQLLYSSELRYRQRMEELDEFTRFHDITPMLQKKVRRYIQFQWAVTRGIDIDTLAGGLPKHMQLEIRLQLNQRLVEAVDIFAGCLPAFFEELVSKLVPCTAVEGEPIFNEGEHGGRMFFVKRGQVLVRKGGSLIATLKEGQYFGELALLTDRPRSTDVIALTDIILLALSRDDFEEVLELFPDSRFRIEAAAEARLRDLREKEALEGPRLSNPDVGGGLMGSRSNSRDASPSVGRRISIAADREKRASKGEMRSSQLSQTRIHPDATPVQPEPLAGSRHSSDATNTTTTSSTSASGAAPSPASLLERKASVGSGLFGRRRSSAANQASLMNSAAAAAAAAAAAQSTRAFRTEGPPPQLGQGRRLSLDSQDAGAHAQRQKRRSSTESSSSIKSASDAVAMAASEEAIAASVRREMAAMAEALRGENTQARREVTDKVEEL